jgi:trimeric autotransporter adhesin
VAASRTVGPATGGDGETRNHVAAFDAATGALEPWDPNADGNVIVLAVNGGTVYVGGTFANIGGQSRSQIAALDGASGAATPWNPHATGAAWAWDRYMTGVDALAVSDGIVYAGGRFTGIGGQSRSGMAALDATTGAATGWNANPNGPNVSDVVANGGRVYTSGNFNTIGGQTRYNIAALDPGTAAATAWNPNSNSQFTGAMAFSDDRVYAGGDFTNIGGQLRNHIASSFPPRRWS